MCNKKKIPYLFVSALLPLQAVELDLLYGHYEIQTDYEVGVGWTLGASYNLNDDFNDRSQIRRLDASGLRIIAPPRAQGVLNESLSFLGPVGQNAWVLPQSFQAGNQFLGMRVIADPFIFQTRVGDNYSNIGIGTVSLKMLGVTGTGPSRGGEFALWETGSFGDNIVYLNTRDGISEDDELPTLPAGAHSHFNWGFTAPGSYLIELEVAGRLRPTGEPTSVRQTFEFLVPHSGAVDGVRAILCHEEGRWALGLADQEHGVIYGEGRALVEVAAAPEPAGGFACSCSFDAAGLALSDQAGLPGSLAQKGAAIDFPNDLRIRLVDHTGPGEVSFGSYFQTADGIDESDEFPLESAVSDLLNFTDAGIHTLTFRASGSDAHGAEMASGLLTFRCVAGLKIDYDFAAWADSYERGYGVPAGTLSDPNGDLDGDGLDHRLEFLLDAAGADPMTANGSLTQVEIEEGGTHGRMIFLRDLHKDRLASSSPELISASSDNLVFWSRLSPLNPGFPLEFFETGAEEGNAVSLIMMRALRREISADGKGFFRLESN